MLLNDRREWTGRALKLVAVGMLGLGPFSSAIAVVPAACVGDSPVSVTRWVWKNRPSVAAPDSERFITSNFLEAIHRDTAQAKADNEICGICSGDLWTNSQEGYARDPMGFKQTMRNGDNAEVVYSFRFSIEQTGPTEARSTRIVLHRETGCWKIDDILYGIDSLKHLVKRQM